MAVAVGSTVRLNVDKLELRFNEVGPEVNFNSPMVVASITGNMAACTRQGVPAGSFLVTELVDIPAPTALPPAPLVPDALP